MTMPQAPKGEIGSIEALPTWGTLAGGFEQASEPPAVMWPQSVTTYSRMRNDPQIDSLCNSITMPISRLRWRLNPNGARDEVVQRVSTDINIPIKGSNDPAPRSRRRFNHAEHLGNAILALWYGSMFFEQVPDERFDLATDGWRLRKLAPRMPGSIEKIHVAKDGGLEGITQYGWRPPRARRQGLILLTNDSEPQIPVSGLAAYVWRREGNNWRGRSMLRPLYQPWILKDRALRVDAMKNERYGVGIPTGTAPEGGDPVQYAKMAQAIRASETSGVGLAAGSSIGVEGIRGTLPDVLASIRYYDELMARAFMAMILQLGQTETGSRALGQTFADFFQMHIEGVANWYQGITNEHVIEDLVDWNFSEEEQAPLLEWGYADDEEPLAVTDLVQMVDSGIVTMDAETENLVRERSNLPELDEAARERIIVEQERPAIAASDHTGVTKRKGVRKGKPKINTPAVESGARFLGRKQTIDSPKIGHRQPNQFELAAQTDFEVLQERWQDATANIVSTWRSQVQASQTEALLEQIRAAVETGNLTLLASLSAPVEGVDVLAAAMMEMAEDALVGAKEEAREQGVDIGTINVAERVEPTVAARAQATAVLLARSFSDNAARSALGLGTGLSPDDVVASVREHLEGLTDAYLNDMLGGAMTQAQNTGRRAVMIEKPATIYASELLDENTCSDCSAVDAREYAGLTAAEEDYPTGGFRSCQGGPRCRGTLVAVYDEASE